MRELIMKTTTTRPLSIMPPFSLMWNLDESIMSLFQILHWKYQHPPLVMVSHRLTYILKQQRLRESPVYGGRHWLIKCRVRSINCKAICKYLFKKMIIDCYFSYIKYDMIPFLLLIPSTNALLAKHRLHLFVQPNILKMISL